MRRLWTKPDAQAHIVAAALWAMLWIAVIVVVVMTWHPWVVGANAGCPAGQHDSWDGRCRPG